MVLVVVVALLPQTVTPAASGQTPVPITGIACDGCTIELRRLISLSDSAVPGTIGYFPYAARDSRRRWYIAGHPEGLLHVAVFDPDGRFLRVLGRSGQGPGEFGSIRGLHIQPGDTLHVYDNALRRRSVFSPDGAFVRVDALSAMIIGADVLPDTRTIVVADVRTPDAIGYPLHILGADGQIEESFGTPLDALRPGQGGLERSRGLGEAKVRCGIPRAQPARIHPDGASGS